MDKFLEGLYEEYKILQDKIDKIADFGLKVRGWCITLQSAIIVALVSGKLLVDSHSQYLVVIFMFLVVTLFHFLEQEQIETRKILSERARKVEFAIDRLMVVRDEPRARSLAINNAALKNLKGSPRIAIDLSNHGRNRTVRALKELIKLANWKIHLFYYFQYILLVLVMVFMALTQSFSDSPIDKNSKVYSSPQICLIEAIND